MVCSPTEVAAPRRCNPHQPMATPAATQAAATAGIFQAGRARAAWSRRGDGCLAAFAESESRFRRFRSARRSAALW